jgi:putative aldouronate transport system substrate-binding protein
MLRRTLLKTTAAAAIVAAWGLPASADPTPIRFVSKDLLTTNPDDVKEMQAVEAGMKAEGTDLDIQIIDMPSAGYADALSVKLLSGDIPDLIYFQGGDQKFADQGVLEDLTPWIAKEPNLKAALWPHNVARLKNYPYLLYIYPPRAPQPVMRKDWFDKLGLPMPQTTDDYTKLFQAIHDADLDGDGKTGDTYGLTGYLNTDELDSIFNQAFGVTGSWMKDASGAWVNARITAQQKAKIAYYADLAAKGLFDKEYVTNTYDVKEDKFYTGKAGVIFGSSPEVIDIYGGKMQQAHPDTKIQLILLPLPKGPGGQGLQAVDVSKESRGFAIASTSTHKEEVAKLLDFMASKPGQDIDRMGFEGDEYTKDASGNVTFTDKFSTWYARFFAAANWTPPAPILGAAAQQALDNITKWFKPDNAFVWTADYAASLDATEKVYRSWVAKFITGEAGMDQWDAYVAEFNGAGNQQMTDYAKTVLK